jgi:hypothetical protein
MPHEAAFRELRLIRSCSRILNKYAVLFMKIGGVGAWIFQAEMVV